MTAYTTRPEIIDAIFFDGTNVSDRPSWLFDALLMPPGSIGAMERTAGGLEVTTSSGSMEATANCWVFQHSSGALMVMDDATFKLDYEPVTPPAPPVPPAPEPVPAPAPAPEPAPTPDPAPAPVAS